mgnify:CR=1 FL=1
MKNKICNAKSSKLKGNSKKRYTEACDYISKFSEDINVAQNNLKQKLDKIKQNVLQEKPIIATNNLAKARYAQANATNNASNPLNRLNNILTFGF